MLENLLFKFKMAKRKYGIKLIFWLASKIKYRIHSNTEVTRILGHYDTLKRNKICILRLGGYGGVINDYQNPNPNRYYDTKTKEKFNNPLR